MSDFYRDGEELQKTTLSQAPGKKKLLVGAPLAIVGGLLWALNIPGGMGLCVLLGGYALVGLVEVLGGSSLVAAAKNWDALPGWKKFLIAASTIGVAIIGACLLIPILGG